MSSRRFEWSANVGVDQCESPESAGGDILVKAITRARVGFSQSGSGWSQGQVSGGSRLIRRARRITASRDGSLCSLTVCSLTAEPGRTTAAGLTLVGAPPCRFFRSLGASDTRPA